MIIEIIIIISIFIGLHYLLMNRSKDSFKESKTKQSVPLKSLEWGSNQNCPPGTKPSKTQGGWSETLCCESGKATTWGFGAHCLYQKNGTYCYTNDMCASGNCNGWGGITEGICV